MESSPARSTQFLPQGIVLDDRYIVGDVLGQGGFGIAYLAEDRLVGDRVVLKELFPTGAFRDPDGTIRFGEGSNPQRLRQAFLDEVKTIARLRISGVVSPRSTFLDRGTAYFTTQFLSGARTAERVLDEEGPLEVARVQRWFEILATVLGEVHAKGILHRDVKPTNILIDGSDRPILIDFGSAREWHADQTQHHTVLFTPGYAAPEQLSERAIRGPATDLYGLAATAWHLLTGSPPPTAADRVAGIPLPSLYGVPDPFATVIERCLQLRIESRPATAAALLDVLREEGRATPVLSFEQLDDLIERSQKFRPEPRGCPECDDLLIDVKPLKSGICPVCRHGKMVTRTFEDRRCPSCRTGVLETVANAPRPGICPSCGQGLLKKEPGIPWKDSKFRCACGAQFVESKSGEVSHENVVRTWDEWREASGRSTEVRRCGDCHAVFDVLADGSWQRGNDRFFPEEWARIALGLDPGAGNVICAACEAEFFAEAEAITLLGATMDPFGFADRFIGRRLDADHVPWLSLGKTSGKPGFLCDTCRLELDKDGGRLLLVTAHSARMVEHLGESKTLDDWQRLGSGVVPAEGLPALIETLREGIAAQYVSGQLAFGDHGVIWSGPAEHGEKGRGNLVIHRDVIAFGGLIRKQQIPMATVLDAWGEGDELGIVTDGEVAEYLFTIVPQDIRVDLHSGRHTIRLDAARLAARLRNLVL